MVNARSRVRFRVMVMFLPGANARASVSVKLY